MVPDNLHASMSAQPWQFAIDVGGTFTDCMAYAPDGRMLRHKLLSSGVIKGNVGVGSTAEKLVDLTRQGDPPDFWVGYQLSLLDQSGDAVATSYVVSFDKNSGVFALEPPLPAAPAVGIGYELACDLAAPVIGIRYLLELPLAMTVPPVQLRLGTTRGTNALLTRSGARTALVTTRGFGDLLAIGYQDRPELFTLTVTKPLPLVELSVEVDERVGSDGTVLIQLDEDGVARSLKEAHRDGIEALAICLLHGDLYPMHEKRIAKIASAIGFTQVSRSSEVAPLVKVVSRAETTVVDAYLRPVLKAYLQDIQRSLPGSQLRLMTSAGGLVSENDFRGHESVLSGPAGGVVGYVQAARSAGFERAIGFDMGGTSTDVSRFDGEYEFEYESHKAGVRLIAPALAIETVAAGGGSLCQFDGTKLTVGPGSAGADPGPACYGRGGPLTVTDVNFYLGRIAQDWFPFKLLAEPVSARLEQLASEVQQTMGEKLNNTQLAEGLLQIANANMARAVREVSIAKGASPDDYVLVAFGGAGAQHACAVARELGIRQVLNHPQAGILSAFGIALADEVRHASVGMSTRLSEVRNAELVQEFAELASASKQQLLDSGCDGEHLHVELSLDMRYTGTDAVQTIAWQVATSLRDAFEQQHRKLFGYIHESREIEITALRARAVFKASRQVAASLHCTPVTCKPYQEVRVTFAGCEQPAPLFDRESLSEGAYFSGPAIVADPHSTIVVEPGWQAEVLSGGDLLLTDHGEASHALQIAGAAEAVKIEIFNNLFAGVAEQMGHVLRRTAVSVNVKERLDYSCAVFTAAGELVANAPHVPVHLGAMGTTVRAILSERKQMHPGDVYVTNDPYRGGSHLPDVTVVTPVHHQNTGELLFFTACRAHHAEIGGIRPGSMPPQSRNLAEEGVLISNFALIENGESREDDFRALLSTGSYPSRRVEENLADLRAQVAANRHGAEDLLALIARYSLPVVQRQLLAIQAAAETKVRQALGRLNMRTSEFTDYLEATDGASVPIRVNLTFHSGSELPAVSFDFTGTSPVVAGNLNANAAIVTAAVLYVLRLLVDEDIPLNEGALRAVEILLPEGLLNPKAGETPASTPAVAAGNVETSQRVVDVLLGALGVAGASQGTMNNLLFGDETFGYYETIAGGSGATAENSGADAVQVHMTNTRCTDPEVLERRLPVRLWEFSIRQGSGGAGLHRGGNGAVRRMEFLRPLELSLITQRRGPHPPYGMKGGLPGALGENWLTRASGVRDPLPAICEIDVQPGDVLELKTPGGGGFGTL